MSSTTDIVKCFFTKIDDNTYVCICKTKLTQKKNTGYTNLKNHVLSTHKDYEATLLLHNNQKKLGFCPSESNKKVYYWMRTVIMSNLPFSFVENEYIREGSRYNPISTDTFMKYLEHLDGAVVQKIKNILPEKFGIVFDGWSSGTTHFVALYAVFPDKEGKRIQILLAMQPLPDETNQTSENHVEFITDILSIHYHRHIESVLFICADNCNTNKSIASQLNVPLIGCHSHIFNLAVEKYLDDYKDIIIKIDKLSGKLRNRKAAGMLRSFGCKLEAISRNATRWSSCYAMLKRFREIKSFITVAHFPSLADLIPTPMDEGRLQGLYTNLEKLQSITLTLQKNDLKLSEARALFDGALQIIPEAGIEYLQMNANILMPKSSIYISGIVKIQNEESDTLLSLEKQLLEASSFKISHEISNTSTPESGANTDFAMDLLNSRKKQKISPKYCNLDWIPPTSNVVERLFSLARLTFTDYRRATLPENLESTLFLKVNHELWDIETVSTLMNSTD